MTLQTIINVSDNNELVRATITSACNNLQVDWNWYGNFDNIFLPDLDLVVVFGNPLGGTVEKAVDVITRLVTKPTIEKEQVFYSVKGYVLGNLWDTTQGILPVKHFPLIEGEFGKEVLITQVANAFQDNKLTGTDDFSSLIGAIVYITQRTSVTIAGKYFINETIEVEQVGKLTEEQREQLLMAEFD